MSKIPQQVEKGARQSKVHRGERRESTLREHESDKLIMGIDKGESIITEKPGKFTYLNLDDIDMDIPMAAEGEPEQK